MGWQYKLYCMIIKKRQKKTYGKPWCLLIKRGIHTLCLKVSISNYFQFSLGRKRIDIYLCPYKNKYYVKLFTSFNQKGGTFLFKLIKSLHIHYPSALLYLRICKILIRRVWFDYNNYDLNAFSFIGNMKGHRTVNPFWISFRQEEKSFYITELSVLSESWICLASLIFSALSFSLTFHWFFFNFMLFVHHFRSDLNKNQTLKWKKILIRINDKNSGITH